MILSTISPDKIILASRTAIYDAIFQVEGGINQRSIRGEAYDYKHTHFSDSELQEKCNQLAQRIAFDMFVNGVEICKERTYHILCRELFSNYEDKMDNGNFLSGGYYTYMRYTERNKGNKEIRFIHRSLYEYFTAVYMFEEIYHALNKEKFEFDNLHVVLGKLFGRKKISLEIWGYLKDKLTIACQSDFPEQLYFTQYFKNIETWERIWEKMLSQGMCSEVGYNSKYYADIENTERLCFCNMIEFLQMVKSVIGYVEVFPRDNLDIRETLARRLRVDEFRNLNLASFNLSEMNLNGATLRECSFINADLSNAVLDNATMEYSDFESAKLTGTSFTGTKLGGSTIAWKTVNNSGKRAFFTITNDMPHWSKELLPGNMVEFGWYYTWNGSKYIIHPILWQVLDVKGGKALLITNSCVEYMSYHMEQGEINWEKSTVRGWLNGYVSDDYPNPIQFKGKYNNFIDTAFNSEQKRCILKMPIEPHANPNAEYQEECDQGKMSMDKVFLLSAEEIIKYYARPDSQKYSDSIYILGKQAASRDEENDPIEYWLRTVAYSGYSELIEDDREIKTYEAVCVTQYGDIILSGVDIKETLGVRPAMWVDIATWRPNVESEFSKDSDRIIKGLYSKE